MKKKINATCRILPGENCDDNSIPRNTDDADNGNVHSETINEPIRGGLDDVTVAQPMRVQIWSAVIVKFSPRDRIS